MERLNENYANANEELAYGQVARPRFRQPLELRNCMAAGAVFEVEDDEEDWDLFEDYSEENYEDETYAVFQSYVPADTTMRVMELDSPERKDNHFDASNVHAMSFLEMENYMENLNEDGTVKKMVIKNGNGIKVPDRCRLYFHYMAFADGIAEPFDTSLLRNYPQCTDLRETGILLSGLEVAVRSMELSEASRFIVYPAMAFGEAGCPPRIPSNTKILYIVETLQYIDEQRLNTPLYMSPEQRNTLPFEEIFQLCSDLRIEGNGLYKQGNFQFAIKKWRKGIMMLEEYPVANQADNTKRSELLHTTYSNLAQAYLKLEKPAQACSACKIGLKMVDGMNSLKLLYRFAKAKLMLRDCDAALAIVEEALRIDKHDKSLKQLEREIREEDGLQMNAKKKMWSGLFKKPKDRASGSPKTVRKLEQLDDSSMKSVGASPSRPMARSQSVLTMMGEDEEERYGAIKDVKQKMQDLSVDEVSNANLTFGIDLDDEVNPYAYTSEEYLRNNLPLGDCGDIESTAVNVLEKLPSVCVNFSELKEENANMIPEETNEGINEEDKEGNGAEEKRMEKK